MVRSVPPKLTEDELREADHVTADAIHQIADIAKLRRFEHYFRDCGFYTTADACVQRLRSLSDAWDSNDRLGAAEMKKSFLSDILSFQAEMNATESQAAAAVRNRSPEDPLVALPKRKPGDTSKQPSHKLDWKAVVAQNKDLSAVERKAVAEDHKNKGNEHFQQRQYDDARDCYTVAINLHAAWQYYANRAAALLHLKEYHQCIADCDKGLRLHPAQPKMLLRRAKSYSELKKYKECLEDAEAGLLVCPDEDEFIKLRQKAREVLGLATATKVMVVEDGDVSSDDDGEHAVDQGLPATVKPGVRSAAPTQQASANGNSSTLTAVRVQDYTDSDTDSDDDAETQPSLQPGRTPAASSNGAAGGSAAQPHLPHQPEVLPGAPALAAAVPGAVSPAVGADLLAAASQDQADAESFASADSEPSSFISCPSSGSESDDGELDFSNEDSLLQIEVVELQEKLDELQRQQLETPDFQQVQREVVQQGENEKLLGNDRFKEGDIKSALAHYLKAVALVPNKDLLHFNCAVAYLKSGQDMDAVRSATIALSLNKQYYKAYRQRALAKQSLGYLEGAKEDFEAAAQLAPDEKQRSTTRSNIQQVAAALREVELKRQQEHIRTKSARTTTHRSVVIEEVDDGPVDFAAKRLKDKVQQTEADAAAIATRAPRKAIAVVEEHVQQRLKDQRQQHNDAVELTKQLIKDKEEQRERLKAKHAAQRQERAEQRAAKKAAKHTRRRSPTKPASSASPAPATAAAAGSKAAAPAVKADAPAPQAPTRACKVAPKAAAAAASAAPASPPAANGAAAGGAEATASAVASAEEQFKKDLAEQHSDKGKQAFQDGKWQTARDLFQRAHQLVPTDPRFLNNLARALLKCGEHPQALEAAEESARLLNDKDETPDNRKLLGKAMVIKIDALAALGQIMPAMRCLQTAKPYLTADAVQDKNQELVAAMRSKTPAKAASAPASVAAEPQAVMSATATTEQRSGVESDGANGNQLRGAGGAAGRKSPEVNVPAAGTSGSKQREEGPATSASGSKQCEGAPATGPSGSKQRDMTAAASTSGSKEREAVPAVGTSGSKQREAVASTSVTKAERAREPAANGSKQQSSPPSGQALSSSPAAAGAATTAGAASADTAAELDKRIQEVIKADPATGALHKAFDFMAQVKEHPAATVKQLKAILLDPQQVAKWLSMMDSPDRCYEMCICLSKGVTPAEFEDAYEMCEKTNREYEEKVKGQSKNYRRRRASVAYSVCLQRCPSYCRALMELMHVQKKQKNWKGVIENGFKVLRLGYVSDKAVDYRMALAYFQQGQYERAKVHIQAIKNRHNKDQQPLVDPDILTLERKIEQCARGKGPVDPQEQNYAEQILKANLFSNQLIATILYSAVEHHIPAPVPEDDAPVPDQDRDQQPKSAATAPPASTSSTPSTAATAASPTPHPAPAPPANTPSSSTPAPATTAPHGNGNTSSSTAAAPPPTSRTAAPAAPQPSSSATSTTTSPSGCTPPASNGTTATKATQQPPRTTPSPTSTPSTKAPHQAASVPAAARPSSPQPTASSGPASTSQQQQQQQQQKEASGETRKRIVQHIAITEINSDSDSDEVELKPRSSKASSTRFAPAAGPSPGTAGAPSAGNGSARASSTASKRAAGGLSAVADAAAAAEAAFALQQQRAQKLQVPKTAVEFERKCKELVSSGLDAELGRYISMIEPKQYRTIFKVSLSAGMVASLAEGLAHSAEDNPAFAYQALDLLTKVDRFAMIAASLMPAMKAKVAEVVAVLEEAGLPVDELKSAYRLPRDE